MWGGAQPRSGSCAASSGWSTAGMTLGDLPERERRPGLDQGGRQAREPEAQGRRPRLGGHDRHRPHPLGDPRPRDRGERPPAHGGRGPVRRDRAQRHHRELRRDQAGPDRRRRPLQLGDRRRGGRPPRQALLLGRPGRGRACDVRPAHRPLRLHRDAPRPSGPARRHAPSVPADRRRRRWRDLPGLLDHRVLRRDPAHEVHRGRRDRGRDARCGRHPRRPRRALPARRRRRPLGRRDRAEGRLRQLHAQGDPRAAARRRRDDRAQPARRRPQSRARRRLRARRRAARPDPRLRHGATTPGRSGAT